MMTEEQKKAHPLYGVYVQYLEACAQRDAIYAKHQPLEGQVAQLSAQIEELRAQQAKIVAQIDADLGVPFLQLKKRIGVMARALGEPGGLLAS